jgi:hypothetical protein
LNQAIPIVRIGRCVRFDPQRLDRWVADHAVEPASDDTKSQT